MKMTLRNSMAAILNKKKVIIFHFRDSYEKCDAKVRKILLLKTPFKTPSLSDKKHEKGRKTIQANKRKKRKKTNTNM